MWIDRARRTFQHLERKELERLQDFEVRVTDRGGKGVANRSSRLAKKAECYCTSTRLINLNCFPHIKAVFQEQADSAESAERTLFQALLSRTSAVSTTDRRKFQSLIPALFPLC